MVDVFFCYALAGVSALLGGLLTRMLPRTLLGEDVRVVIWLYRAGFALLTPMTLMGILGPTARQAALPWVMALAAAGTACLGWALRELEGRPLPRVIGIVLVSLCALAVVLCSLASEAGFAIGANAVFTSIGAMLLADQTRLFSRRHAFSRSEIGLVAVLMAYTAIFGTALGHALLSRPEHIPPHGLLLPGSLLPVGAGMLALMPLAVSALAFAVINERLIKRLEGLALTDALTGLWSRRGLGELAPLLIAEHLRRNVPVAVMMIDIDHFKRINDGHGHAIGDLALQRVSAELKSHLRADALLARYGGEEFTALVPVPHANDMAALGERLREAVANAACPIPGGMMKITVSIGAACLEPGGELHAAMAAADARLYQAKQGGRNRVVCA